MGDTLIDQPGRHLPQRRVERREAAHLSPALGPLARATHRYRDLSLVDIDPRDPLIHNLHQALRPTRPVTTPTARRPRNPRSNHETDIRARRRQPGVPTGRVSASLSHPDTKCQERSTLAVGVPTSFRASGGPRP